MPPSASPLVTFGIAGLAMLVAALGALSYARASGPWSEGGPRRFAIAVAVIDVWMGLLLVLAALGVLARFDARPPPLVVAMFATVGLGAFVGLGPAGRRLADNLSFAWLVGLQAFRLPLELIMHRAAREGVMPVQMTFGAGGWNHDIVTGALATLLLPVLARRDARALVALWNVLGLALLANIAVVAIVSTPVIAAFGRAPERLNTWVAYPPFIWMAVFVSVALAGHIVVARKLMTTAP